MIELRITRIQLLRAGVSAMGLVGKGWPTYVRGLLEDAGFDFSKTIEVHQDYQTPGYLYRQKEADDGQTQTEATEGAVSDERT